MGGEVSKMPRPLGKLEDAASYLNISVNALRKRIERHGFPKGIVIRIGESYRFDMDKLVAAATSGELSL